MTKLTKARKPYTCHQCKEPIAKGGLYAKRSIRLGSSKSDSVENVDGVASIVSQGLTVSVKHCAACST